MTPLRERLIHALDLPNAESARRHVERLGDSVHCYKLGLELWSTRGGQRLLDWLLARDKQVFVDLKLFDIPRTVAAATRNLRGRGIRYLSVYGDRDSLAAAVAEKGDMRILAITVLTSMDAVGLAELGMVGSVEDSVISRSKLAHAAGCDGVVCSARETPRLRRELGDALTAVTPGIRLSPERMRDADDDQKRTVHLRTAFANGADHVVVGRPILNAKDPAQAAAAMQDIIASICQG